MLALRFSFRTKIMGLMALVVTLLITSSNIIVRNNMGTYLDSHLYQMGVSLASDYADPGRAPALVASNNLELLRRLIRTTVTKNHDVRYILITDADGNFIVHSFEQGVPRGLEKFNRYVGVEEHSIVPVQLGSEEIADVAVAMPGTNGGLVRVGMTKQNMDAMLTDITQKMIISGAIIWLLSTVVSYIFVRILTRPISELVERTKFLAKGDYNNAKMQSSSTITEVQSLSDSFNKMIDNLRLSRQETEELNEKRKKLIAQTFTVQEEERKRISRELHDQAGQYLTAISLELTVIENASSMEEIHHRIKNIRGMISKILEHIKNLIWELRPSSLDDLGLEAAIKRHILGPLEGVGISADLQVYDLDGLKLSPEVTTTVFRVIQEAVTNAVKHGKASSISIVLTNNGKVLSVIVEDNGKGFEVDAVRNRAVRDKKFGLFGMEERAALVNGQLIIESMERIGTTIYLKVPVSGEGISFENQSPAGR